MSYLDIAKGLQQPTTGTYRAFRASNKTTTPLVVNSQELPCSCAVSAKSAVSPRLAYPPLDAVIAADMATKYPREEIAARVERLAARAALPSVTALDRVIADDWKAILDAKQGDRR